MDEIPLYNCSRNSVPEVRLLRSAAGGSLFIPTSLIRDGIYARDFFIRLLKGKDGMICQCWRLGSCPEEKKELPDFFHRGVLNRRIPKRVARPHKTMDTASEAKAIPSSRVFLVISRIDGNRNQFLSYLPDRTIFHRLNVDTSNIRNDE